MKAGERKVNAIVRKTEDYFAQTALD